MGVDKNPRLDVEKNYRKPEDVIRKAEPVVPVHSEIVAEKETIVTQAYSGLLADIEKVKSEWHEFLNNLAPTNQSLVGLLRSALPVNIDGKNLTLEVLIQLILFEIRHKQYSGPSMLILANYYHPEDYHLRIRH